MDQAQAVHANAVDGVQHCSDDNEVREIRPCCLPPRRGYDNRKRSPFLVPDPVIVRALHMEYVFTRLKVRVCRRAGIS
jgi:hypothetical protein